MTFGQKIIHQEGGKWYFWHEDWCHRSGPYETEEEANKRLGEYIDEELGR